ncbi:MAG TPA: c-type cytochrome, partial [Cyclobacteriaceae bacterium]|nr:c-type cytochrome [Cyclobacteriaceae bacterium]
MYRQGAAIAFVILLSCHVNDRSDVSWAAYRGDQGCSGYSTLDQINKENVKDLDVAWIYHTGDASEGNRSTIQCNPIIVNDMMYVTSPKLKLIALDPANGKEIWKFDPFPDGNASGVNRGVTYWEEGNDRRIFFSAGPYLYSINADSGKLINDFGEKGKVDLRNGLGRDPEKLAVWATSPGVVYEDILIQGTALNEGYDAAPGFVRAYDVHDGKVIWTFHTIPQPGEYGYDTWDENAYKEVGGTNSWAGMSIDQKRGLVFIPTGSPAFDFYGGNRKGENLFGNCLIALDVRTGERKWHYQLVHHDLWDYDLPAPPVLVTVSTKDGDVDAVVQVTKMGMAFLFNRETGEPIFPIEERPVPASDLVGEVTWPTQPFPTKPLPFVRHEYSWSTVTDISEEAHSSVIKKLENSRIGPIYTPPSTAGSVQFPGTRGGAEWGGASVDPATGILYVNANEVPMLFRMKAIDQTDDESLFMKGKKIFALNNCTTCHGADRSGVANAPSLLDLSKRLSKSGVHDIVKAGKGQMPAFPNLSEEEFEALMKFLFDESNLLPDEGRRGDENETITRYVHEGWNVLTDQDGYPGVKPPWGTLNAIDLNKGEFVWQIPLGEFS